MNEPRSQQAKKKKIAAAKTDAKTDDATIQSFGFSCYAPEVQAVFVAGCFNNWSKDALPLVRQPDGHWRADVPLLRGNYEYKFVVDGQWCCEADCEPEYHGCPKCVPNGFGTMNRVLEMS